MLRVALEGCYAIRLKMRQSARPDAICAMGRLAPLPPSSHSSSAATVVSTLAYVDTVIIFAISLFAPRRYAISAHAALLMPRWLDMARARRCLLTHAGWRHACLPAAASAPRGTCQRRFHVSHWFVFSTRAYSSPASGADWPPVILPSLAGYARVFRRLCYLMSAMARPCY